jgi:hypothetical protein
MGFDCHPREEIMQRPLSAVVAALVVGGLVGAAVVASNGKRFL